MLVEAIDHVVLTVADVEATARFYATVLGLEVVTFAGGRTALAFGRQKINLHPAGREFEPKAGAPTPGSADLCFVTHTPTAEIVARLRALGIPIVAGPDRRDGALGPTRSVYLRDPDGNLVELANYEEGSEGSGAP